MKHARQLLQTRVTNIIWKHKLLLTHLKCDEKGHRLHGVVPAVHIVAHEQIVRIWRVATNAKQFHQVMELAVHISAYCDGTAYLLDIAFLLQYLLGLRERNTISRQDDWEFKKQQQHSGKTTDRYLFAKLFDLAFLQLLTIIQLFYPWVQLFRNGPIFHGRGLQRIQLCNTVSSRTHPYVSDLLKISSKRKTKQQCKSSGAAGRIFRTTTFTRWRHTSVADYDPTFCDLLGYTYTCTCTQIYFCTIM